MAYLRWLRGFYLFTTVKDRIIILYPPFRHIKIGPCITTIFFHATPATFTPPAPGHRLRQ